ncbi:hypothetical protein JFL43_15975 [Viridibacillus sp. YIM B01967]|uniref:DUF3923 domain-containing protein n=1 Tax=Viridibacillus soli TaxID=2798301 RepID=A0ABS1HA96_9BACL|nr:hypothetical protein [Viridibacillus soli]MBK3496331.1 hypothetical protein [Viridibacillus soli]
MFKYFFIFSLVFITQLIGVLMWGEFIWHYKLKSFGDVTGTAIDQISPGIWVLLLLELIIFGVLVNSQKMKLGSSSSKE